ncbi:hypothetical protein ACJIZ3_016728 [Penstemon smallii]|uniref:Uncharacterized protein n=1 Tax=Penstemon smallii TaxID=265156 RepID=A0ABD3SU38_9LAMI
MNNNYNNKLVTLPIPKRLSTKLIQPMWISFSLKGNKSNILGVKK